MVPIYYYLSQSNLAIAPIDLVVKRVLLTLGVIVTIYVAIWVFDKINN